MSGKYKERRGTYLGTVVARDHDEARELVINTLRKTSGKVKEAAFLLGVSIPYIHHVLQQLGIQHLPIEFRRRAKNYFRLPNAASVTTEK